jgi:hypothetical protein
MELSSEERTFLEARLKQHRENRAFKDNLQRLILEDNKRREAVGKRYRQIVIRKAMEAAGIDYNDILERQEKENTAAREQFANLRSEIASNVPRVAERQEKWINDFLKHPPHIGRKSPPFPQGFELGELLEPVYMSFASTAGNGNIESHGPGKNVFKWFWNHYGDSSSSGDGVGNFTFAFTPPVNGLLGVAIPVAYNGSMIGAIDSSCFEGGDLSITSSVGLTLDQAVPGTMDLGGSLAFGGLDFEKSRSASCWSQTYANIFDETDVVETTNPLLVVANHIVLITVVVTIEASFDNGGLNVDFFSNAQGVTVPGVLFGLTPV